MMLHQLITEAAKDKKELSRRAWPNGQGIVILDDFPDQDPGLYFFVAPDLEPWKPSTADIQADDWFLRDYTKGPARHKMPGTQTEHKERSKLLSLLYGAGIGYALVGLGYVGYSLFSKLL